MNSRQVAGIRGARGREAVPPVSQVKTDGPLVVIGANVARALELVPWMGERLVKAFGKLGAAVTGNSPGLWWMAPVEERYKAVAVGFLLVVALLLGGRYLTGLVGLDVTWVEVSTAAGVALLAMGMIS